MPPTMNGLSVTDDQLSYCFAPFRFDPASGELWSAAEPVRLRPKTAAVLSYLLERPGRLVTREELWRAVWPGTHGSEQAPKQCIRELRVILGDTASEPRFIETVGRRGYRFIAPAAPPEGSSEVPGERAATSVSPRICVGRDAELTALATCLDRVRQGERQVVFVTGEAGIGKTTLIEHFADNLAQSDTWVANGLCLPHQGAAEAYGPLLDALDQLRRGSNGARLVPLLERCAPSWLLALPAQAEDGGRRATEDTGTHAASPEHMRRELVEALEAFSADRLGILVLEDLHWSDTATLDWLVTWAARRAPGRVLVVGSFRPAEAVANDHPLPSVIHELSRYGRCRTLPLAALGEDAVATYLRLQVGDAAAGPDLGRLIQRRTGGHPLFLAALIEEWQARHLHDSETGNELAQTLAILGATVPATVRALIEHQFRGLSSDERRLLETASVAGLAFPVAAVAAGLQAELEAVEEACAGLVTRHLFLAPDDPESWPDGTITAGYAFRHALYRQVVYDRVPAGRRAGLHRRIGERLEAGYGADAQRIAVALAEHFVAGGDAVRAVRYLRLAGETALARQAHRAAIEHLQQALAQITRCPEGAQRDQEELRLQTALGAALIVLEGFAAPRVVSAYRRAYRLCRTSAQAQVPALCGLWNDLVTRADLRRARIVSQRLLEISRQTSDPALWLPARNAAGQTALFMGEPAAALSHIDAVLEGHDPDKHRKLFIEYGEDPGVVCHMYGALTRWLLGYPMQAQRHLEAGLALARRLGQPFGLAQMTWMAAVVAQCAGDAARVRGHTAALIRLCREHEVGFWLPGAHVLEGWALAAEGHQRGTAIIREGLQHWRLSGVKIFEPYHFALLAQAYAADGNPAEGLASLDAAVVQVQRSRERWYEAELLRLKAELGPRPGESEAAGFTETCLGRALALAQQQGAKSLELRAAADLARLWQAQGRHSAADALLAPLYGWFTEGLETADIRDARKLLRVLDLHLEEGQGTTPGHDAALPRTRSHVKADGAD